MNVSQNNHPSRNLSLGFILKIFLTFCKFQPRYSYKICSYRKKRVYICNSVKAQGFDHEIILLLSV